MGESVRMMLPIPMNTLVVEVRSGFTQAIVRDTYPNIEPDPTMYFPKVRMTPA